jgi:hypothetical protein
MTPRLPIVLIQWLDQQIPALALNLHWQKESVDLSSPHHLLTRGVILKEAYNER